MCTNMKHKNNKHIHTLYTSLHDVCWPNIVGKKSRVATTPDSGVFSTSIYMKIR